LAAAAGPAVNPAAEVADKLASFFSFLARFSAAVLRSGFFSAPGIGSSPAVLDLKYYIIYLFSFIDLFMKHIDFASYLSQWMEIFRRLLYLCAPL
jgi:hypothetical protein